MSEFNISLEEAQKVVLTVLSRSDNGQIRPNILINVRSYFRKTNGNIPDNCDEMTDYAVSVLLLERKLKKFMDGIGPEYIIRSEFLVE